MTACEKCKREIENLDLDICKRCISDAVAEMESASKILNQYNEMADILYNQIER